MSPILLLWITLVSSALEPPWQDLSFAIVRDSETSSESVTICRVRVTNNGSRTWPGHRIRFEAQALAGEMVLERARGRFGLSLGPHETLETLIGFSGRYERFSVRPLTKSFDKPDENRRGKPSGGGRRHGKRRR